MPLDLLVLSMLRMIAEVAGFAMLGQGVLYVLAGRRRSENFVYQLFAIVTRPVFRLTRAISPRLVRDEHIPIAAFLIVLWLWIALGMAKRYVCLSHGLACPGV